MTYLQILLYFYGLIVCYFTILSLIHHIILFRVSGLSAGGEERARQLAGVARDGGAGAAQGFLAGSVRPPWERAVTPANVPYYIK